MKQTILLAVILFFASAVFAQEKKMQEIKSSDLPKGVTTWVKDNLPDGKITRAGKIDDKGVISYAVAVESKGRKHSYLFDKDGKFVGKGDNLINPPKAPAATGTKAATPAPKGAPATTTTKSSGTNTATEEAAPKK